MLCCRASYKLFFLALFLSLCPVLLTTPVESSRYKKKSVWKYIIIHHSATRKGNADIIDRYHRKKRHMKNGLAYHFVINNGTAGTKDGEVEIGDRWKKQLPGGHVSQRWLNNCAIGICLVGNFNKQYVTKAQYESLVKLVGRLRKTYDIPAENIRGHRQFGGERTECPGDRFPLKKLNRYLKENS